MGDVVGQDLEHDGAATGQQLTGDGRCLRGRGGNTRVDHGDAVSRQQRLAFRLRQQGAARSRCGVYHSVGGNAIDRVRIVGWRRRPHQRVLGAPVSDQLHEAGDGVGGCFES